MAVGEKVPMVFFPRFTTLQGPHNFYTTPIDMLGFGSFEVAFWRGPWSGSGSTPTLIFGFEESQNLTEWSAMTSDTTVTDSDTIYNATLTPTMRYVRGIAKLNEQLAVTCWAVGYGMRTGS